MDGITYDLVLETLRVLFIGAVPVVAAATVAGMIISVFQSATTIVDPSLGYAVRLIAVVVVLYFLVSSFAQSIMMLADQAFH